MRAGRSLTAAALLAANLLAACAAPAPSVSRTTPASPTPTAPAAPSAPPTATSPVPTPRTTPGLAGSPAAAVDAALLDLLPREVDGARLESDAGTAAEIAGDAGIAVLAEAVAVGVYTTGADGGAEGGYAVVTVTRVREGLLDPAFHRDWRDSFDAAVCAQAGGLQGNAEAEIEGHRTFIGTCAGGVRTYHVVLPDGRTLVSLQTLSEGRLGERIVAGLAE